jgi:hypothetical protein
MKNLLRVLSFVYKRFECEWQRSAERRLRLTDLEVDVDEEVGGDWLAFEGRRLEAVLGGWV